MSSTPELPQKAPYVQETEPGKYAWCSCGKSQKQPFCDGSHKDSDMTPMIVDIDVKKNVAWCGCKHSKNKPFCDGSHKEL